MQAVEIQLFLFVCLITGRTEIYVFYFNPLAMSFFSKYLFFLLLLYPFYSQAQSDCNLSLKGRILDADTKLPLAGSTIHLLDGDLKKQSDGHGFFSFEKLCAEKYTLKVSALGF